MAGEYRIDFTIEADHAQILRWTLDVVKEAVVPQLTVLIGEGRCRLGLKPEVTAEEFFSTFMEFWMFMTSRLPRVDEEPLLEEIVISYAVDARQARILRWIVDYVGAEVVPVVAEFVSTGVEGWQVPFAPSTIMCVWLVIWCLVDLKWPLVDGTFDISDVEIAWEIGLN